MVAAQDSTDAVDAAVRAAEYRGERRELAVDLGARLNIVPPRFDAGPLAGPPFVLPRTGREVKAGFMYAVIKTGGKQYKVAKNDVILVEKLTGEAGATVELDEVLMVGDDKGQTVGSPLLAGAHVAATVLEQTRGEKIIVFKKKRRQNYRRKAGHRQDLTALRITDIVTGGKKKAAAKTEAPKAEEKKVTPKAEEKKAAPKKADAAKKAMPKAEADAAKKAMPKAEAEPGKIAMPKPEPEPGTKKVPAKKAEAKPAAKKAPPKKTEAKKASAKPAAEKKAPAKKAAAKKPAAKK